MTDIAVHVRSALDPTGLDLEVLTKEDYVDLSFRVELNGFGSYRLVVNRHSAKATDAVFARHNYLLFENTDLGEGELAGGWIEDNLADLISSDEEGGEDLTFTGPGMLGYLGNAVMLDEALSSFGGPYDIVDGNWRWGSDTYGGILRRVILEATFHPDHSSGLYGNPLEHLGAVTWDDVNDSDGTPWPYSVGDWRIPIGTPLPEVVARLVREDIELLGDPGSFDLSAYVANMHGEDRSGAFGAGVVRFEKGVNIVSNLSREGRALAGVRRPQKPGGRALHASTDASNIIVAGDDRITFRHRAAGSYPIAREVAMQLDTTSDPNALDAAGDRSLGARADRADQVRLQHLTGDDEAGGRYEPGPANHYWIGDTVTIHTGTGTYDYDEAVGRVTAIEWGMSDGVNWDIWVETGGTFSAAPSYRIEPPAVRVLGLELCHDTGGSE